MSAETKYWAKVDGLIKVPLRQRVLLYQPGEEFIPRWLLRRWTASIDEGTPRGLRCGFCGHTAYTKRGMRHWMAGYEAAAASLTASDG